MADAGLALGLGSAGGEGARGVWRRLVVYHDGTEWEATDLASTNGTYLPGRRIVKAEARPGDVLKIGATFVALEAPTRHGSERH